MSACAGCSTRAACLCGVFAPPLYGTEKKGFGGLAARRAKQNAADAELEGWAANTQAHEQSGNFPCLIALFGGPGGAMGIGFFVLASGLIFSRASAKKIGFFFLLVFGGVFALF